MKHALTRWSLLIAGLFGAVQIHASSLAVEPVATGLTHPWAVAFLGDGKMLVTERPGTMRLVQPDGAISDPIVGLPQISAGGQGGLLDVVTDREFAQNRQIYFCFTRPDPDKPSANSTALAAARLSDDGKALQDLRTLFVQRPTYPNRFHFGCRIVDRGDGTLLLGLGDRFSLMQQAQEKDNDIGKVVRLNKDGSVPTDNPWVHGDAPAVWSIGHRNIQGAAMDRQGRLWMLEHGPQGGDELNLIEPGLNYGWPVITYGENYGGGKIGQGMTEAPGMEQPVTYWVPSIAPSGLTVVSSDRYGDDWRGSLLLGSLKFGHLVRLSIQENRVVGRETLLADLGQRVRDVREAPDGQIYLLTDSPNGQLLRLKPAQAR